MSEFKSLVNRLNAIVKKIEDETLVLNAQLLAAKKVKSLIDNRVFNDGKATDEGLIGSYSTKEMYVNRDSFKGARNGFRAKGKNSNSPTFKNGNPRKSMYLDNIDAYQVIDKQTALWFTLSNVASRSNSYIIKKTFVHNL